jgi:hypothetical protein
VKTSEVGSDHIRVHDEQLSKLRCWGIQVTSVNGVGSRKLHQEVVLGVVLLVLLLHLLLSEIEEGFSCSGDDV